MSAVKRGGLGRGLDALLDPLVTEPEQKAGEQNQGIKQVDIHLIDNNLQQPRKDFNEGALQDLASSIKVHGIVQPLIVVQKGERYLIVAGERRFRAARIAGLATVPVLVVDYDEARMHEVALIENIQREDLNPMEEASAIRFLMQQHDMTQEEVAQRLGKSRPAVANSLRLLQLPGQITDKIKMGILTAGHGRALAGLSSTKLQLQLAEECLRLGYSVRALESRIRNMQIKAETPKSKGKPERDTAVVYAQNQLREKLGTKVVIDGTAEKGKITIAYYSKDELNGLFELLNNER